MLGNDLCVMQSHGCRPGGESPQGCSRGPGSSVGLSQGGCVLQAWVSSGLGDHRGSLRGPGVPRAGGLLSCECHISKCVGYGVC